MTEALLRIGTGQQGPREAPARLHGIPMITMGKHDMHCKQATSLAWQCSSSLKSPQALENIVLVSPASPDAALSLVVWDRIHRYPRQHQGGQYPGPYAAGPPHMQYAPAHGWQGPPGLPCCLSCFTLQRSVKQLCPAMSLVLACLDACCGF